jgi:hypothetical protein
MTMNGSRGWVQARSVGQGRWMADEQNKTRRL